MAFGTNKSKENPLAPGSPAATKGTSLLSARDQIMLKEQARLIGLEFRAALMDVLATVDLNRINTSTPPALPSPLDNNNWN